MNWLDLIRQNFNRKLEMMNRSLEQARIAQKNAPSAMESHSDTTRSEKEKLVTAIEIDIGKLKKNMTLIPSQTDQSKGLVGLWHKVKIDNAGQPMEMILVPDGMGGDIIEGVRLISETTPLGMMTRGKQTGKEFQLKGQTISILKVD